MTPIHAKVRLWNIPDGWGVVDAPEVPGGCWVHYSVLAPGLEPLLPGGYVALNYEAVWNQDGFAWRATSVAGSFEDSEAWVQEQAQQALAAVPGHTKLVIEWD